METQNEKGSALKWRKLTQSDYSDTELKLLRLQNIHGAAFYEVCVVSGAGEIWHKYNCWGPATSFGDVWFIPIETLAGLFDVK